MKNQTSTTQAPTRAPLVIAPTTRPNPLLMQRLAAIEGVEYGHLPNVIGLSVEPTRGAA